DGFAQIPQVDVTPQSERVTFAAVSVAARAWDQPILGRVQRDGDVPTDTTGKFDVQTDLPCRFNPADTSVGSLGGIRGNSTSNSHYTTDPRTGRSYPVFID